MHNPLLSSFTFSKVSNSATRILLFTLQTVNSLDSRITSEGNQSKLSRLLEFMHLKLNEIVSKSVKALEEFYEFSTFSTYNNLKLLYYIHVWLHVNSRVNFLEKKGKISSRSKYKPFEGFNALYHFSLPSSRKKKYVEFESWMCDEQNSWKPHKSCLLRKQSNFPAISFMNSIQAWGNAASLH